MTNPKEDDRAISYFSKAIELGLNNDSLLFFYIGQLYFFKKEYDKAIKNFDKAISIYSGTNFFFFKGMALFYKGDMKEGLNCIEKAVEYEPNNQIYSNTLDGLKKIRVKHIGEKALWYSLDFLSKVLQNM